MLLFAPAAVGLVHLCASHKGPGFQTFVHPVLHTIAMCNIGNRLWSKMSQDNLEAMLMVMEKETRMNLDSDNVTDKVVDKTKLLHSSLTA